MRAMRLQRDASRSLPARYRSTAARMMSEGVQSPSAASSTIRSYVARSSRTVQCLLGVDKPGLLAGRLAGSQELLAIIAEFGTANKIAVAGAGAVFRANTPRPRVSGTSRQSLGCPTRAHV